MVEFLLNRCYGGLFQAYFHSISLPLPPLFFPLSLSLPLSFSSSFQAVDHRGITPLLAAYKCGHVEVVEWLLAHVAHLPSDAECHKAFVAPMPQDTDLLPRRTKCLELIMKVPRYLMFEICSVVLSQRWGWSLQSHQSFCCLPLCSFPYQRNINARTQYMCNIPYVFWEETNYTSFVP